MVELRDVQMRFEEKKVLDGFSLKVEPQERLVIMGQTGSGKSTILRLILGTLQPNAGSVFFKQFEITRLKRRKLQQIRRHIGMVYQYSALLSSRNVRDNVALPLEELTDKSRDEIDKIVDEKLELVGMKESKDLLPDELSGGMRKRVALARALVAYQSWRSADLADRAALLSHLSARFNATMRATIVNDGRRIGLVLLDEYIQSVVAVVNGGGFTNVVNVVCDTTKAPTLPECTSLTLVSGGSASTWLWADTTHLSSGGQQALGSLASQRAANNPF